jgi:predicted GNAT superfamily acetyltransferase
MTARIRNLRIEDFPAVLELNSASVHFLSPLDRKRLEDLYARAGYARAAEEDAQVAAFLLAFRENAGYDSPNYLWFSERYEGFLYIDRVVVRTNRRGKGIAGMLYRDLFSFAAQIGVKVVTCEVDILPPNPVSLRFHRNRGFVEVGTLRPYGGAKRVALMEKRMDDGEKPAGG